MKQIFGIVLLLGMVMAVPAFGQLTKPFTPGNLVLADASDDMLIEVDLPDSPEAASAQVVQVVRWELGDTSRRRPLGVAFDPNGVCYVGITGVPTSATEAVEYPAGRGEILRILPDGTMSFHVLPVEVTKGTWVSSYNPNEVFIMSNEPVVPSESYRVRFSGNEISDITLFEVSETTQGDGKALVLPDGRILIPADDANHINIYNESGGKPIGQIATEKGYRSLAYLEDSNEMLAIPGTGTVDRLTMEGEIVGAFDFSLDGLGGVWNFTLIPDGSERFIATNHNGPATSKSLIFIYDSKILDQEPMPQILEIAGLSDFGDADGLATQLFDHAMVVEPTQVLDWPLQ